MKWFFWTPICVVQVLSLPTPPAPTHHPTVIVPAPALTQQPHHHVTVVTMSPSAHTSTVSTSRQNLDAIVQVGPPPPSVACSDSRRALAVTVAPSRHRRSSTSNALRKEEPALRKSREERSSLAPPTLPWTPPAQTQTQTQRERIVWWTDDPSHKLVQRTLQIKLTVRFHPRASKHL